MRMMNQTMVKANIMDLPMFGMYLRERTTLAESSIKVYIDGIKLFLAGNPDIDELEDYNRFLVKMLVKKRGNYYYSMIRHFIKFKVTDTTKKDDILENLIKPTDRDPKTPRVFLRDEKRIEVINNLADEKHQILALLQYITGSRVGGLLRLKILFM